MFGRRSAPGVCALPLTPISNCLSAAHREIRQNKKRARANAMLRASAFHPYFSFGRTVVSSQCGARITSIPEEETTGTGSCDPINAPQRCASRSAQYTRRFTPPSCAPDSQHTALCACRPAARLTPIEMFRDSLSRGRARRLPHSRPARPADRDIHGPVSDPESDPPGALGNFPLRTRPFAPVHDRSARPVRLTSSLEIMA
jgi:hypothetical protein